MGLDLLELVEQSEVVAVLFEQLLAGAFQHCLVDDVALLERVQPVGPCHAPVFRLAVELWLAIHRQRDAPRRVLGGDDAAGDGAPGQRIVAGQLLDLLEERVITTDEVEAD